MNRNFPSVFVVLETDARSSFYQEALGETAKVLTGDAISAHFLKADHGSSPAYILVEGSSSWIQQRLILGALSGGGTAGSWREWYWLFVSSDKSPLSLSLLEALNSVLGSTWQYLHAPMNSLELQQHLRAALPLLRRGNPSSQYRRTSRTIRGLGHEFSNILFKIGARAELAAGESDSTRLQKQLEELQQSIDNGAKLVQALHSIPKESLSLGWHAVPELMTAAVEAALKRRREPKITVTRDFEPVPMLWCDPVAMEIIFNALTNNALRAMPDGGTLALTVKMGKDEAGSVVWMEFRDSGTGIVPANLPRIFDFGFSAWSGDERSLGLGLSISRELTEAQSGSIDVRCSSTGTSVRLSFPAVRRPGGV